MKAKQPITRKLSVGPAAAWRAVAAVGGLDAWFPAIATCEVSGSGAGARRTMTLAGGLGRIVDEVVAVDADRRRLTYRRTESPFPVSSYLGTVEVFESYDGRAVVVWTVDFECEPEARDGVARMLADAIGDGVAGMDDHLASAGG